MKFWDELVFIVIINYDCFYSCLFCWELIKIYVLDIKLEIIEFGVYFF